MTKGFSIRISAGAMILLALMLLVLPLQWVGAMILAAVVHELSHCLTIYLLGGRVNSFRINEHGITMGVTEIAGAREIICALSGPIGSILLLTVAPRLPRTAICGFIHGIYNLIPLFPMDGGRIMRCLFYGLLSPAYAEKVLSWLRFSIVVVIMLCAIWLSLKIGIMPLLLAFLIVRNNMKENPLAKMCLWR